MICTFNSEDFIYGTFEDYIGLFNSHYRSFFVSEPLLGNTPVTMAILQKCLWTPFHHKLAQYNLWEFIFIFDARCISRKFTTNSYLYLFQK